MLSKASDILDYPYEAHLHGGPRDGEIVGIDTPWPRLVSPATDGGQDDVYTRRPMLGGSAPRVIHYRHTERM